jgi:hypothetical protein
LLFAIAAFPALHASAMDQAATAAGAATAPQTAGDAKAPAQAAPQPQNPHQLRDDYLIHVFCGLGVLLVLYPIGRFLIRPWFFRRELLLGALAGDAVVYYYQQFRAGAEVLSKFKPVEYPEPVDGCIFPKPVADAYLASFEYDFSRWYGRKYYIAPLLMLTLLTVAAGGWADEMLRTWASNGAGPGADLRALVASALAGAFVWVISDELDRLRRRDFVSVDVYYYVFRILLAVPFAWALSAVNLEGKLSSARFQPRPCSPLPGASDRSSSNSATTRKPAIWNWRSCNRSARATPSVSRTKALPPSRLWPTPTPST